MILTIIGVSLLLLGIAGVVIDNRTYICSTLLWIASIVSTTIGATISIICITLILINVFYINLNYNDKVADREMLEYRIEHCENTVGNELLYTDILLFNEDLRHTKVLSSNPWTSWFYSWKIAEMDYIDVAELEGNRSGTE